MMLTASARAVALGHLGDVYLYHQLWGYILKMSPDVYELWRAFDGGADPEKVCERFAGRLTGQPPAELVEVLTQFRCLVSAGDTPVDDAIAAVPVKGRWNVWRRRGDELELWCAWGSRPVTRHRLDAAETAIWDAIDGETSAAVIAGDHGRDRVFALLERLAALDVQALKLSPVPLSTYGHRRKWPPYLTSTMPYPELDGAVPEAPDLDAYHREAIANPTEQFDHAETTLAHLFRRPHPALGDRNYGEALVAALIERGVPTGGALRVLEIGGGTGDLAVAASAALRQAGVELRYRVVELSPALAANQRQRGLEVIEGDVLGIEIDDGSIDLVIANEMIGDLRPGTRAAATGTIERFGLDVEGTTDDTLFNIGAFALVERIAGWLAPGGMAVITEFGELHATPRISTHLDHPEVSIRFDHLDTIATRLGLETDYLYVMDLIDMRRDLEALATTRSYFRALSALLADAGVDLDKIGYTREMFDDLLAGKIDAAEIGELHFDKIEDRLMGLVPHEFKALILRKGGES